MDDRDPISDPVIRQVAEHYFGVPLDEMNCDDLADLLDERDDNLSKNSIRIMDISTGFCYGICLSSDSVSLSVGSLRITCFLHSLELVVFDEDLDTEEHFSLVHGTGVDLNASGARWEGNAKDGKPCGYGVLYDEDDRIVYEGFMMNGLKTGYGKEFYSDIGVLRYDGCYCQDLKCGYGILYRRDGSIARKGMWKNDERYSPAFDGTTLDDYTQMLFIDDNSLNSIDSLLIPEWMDTLKWLFISSNCCENVRTFAIDGLPNLQIITVGKVNFTTNKNPRHLVRREIADGVFRVVDCPNLRHIDIFERSFCDYSSCELIDLPSLRCFHADCDCFHFALSFSLKGTFTPYFILSRSS